MAGLMEQLERQEHRSRLGLLLEALSALIREP
jgi:hypothetical protein